jgi:hypothetical protein
MLEGTQYQKEIEAAEMAVGPLTRGEATDLLLDTFEGLTVQAAADLVASIYNRRITRQRAAIKGSFGHE